MQKERLETWFFQKTFIFLNLIRSHLLSIHNADSFYPCSWRNETFCRGTAGVLIMLCEFTYGESPQTSSSYFFLIISNVPVHNVSVWFPSHLFLENTRFKNRLDFQHEYYNKKQQKKQYRENVVQIYVVMFACIHVCKEESQGTLRWYKTSRWLFSIKYIKCIFQALWGHTKKLIVTF